MSRRPVRFVHRDRIVQVEHLHPTTSVLVWLREHAGCTGTKEGCNEGDCGACTVLLGELVGDERHPVRFTPVNSCLTLLPMIDGKALLTVEDLGGSHPAQRALVECHGSQCGFCTPGFVMSLAACHERHAQASTVPTRQQIADDLAGNLCRCTGYRPILDAGERMAAQPAPALASTAMRAALAALRCDPPLDYEGDGGRFCAPQTVDALAARIAQQPSPRILGGNTDIGLWINKQMRRLDDLVHLGRVAELAAIEQAGGLLRIGAAASLQAAWDALARHWPTTREMGLRFASPPLRAAGTMGGNIANGSPIGDSAPVLIALGAQLLLRQGPALRRLALEDFYLDYMKNALRDGEFVAAIEVPLPGPHERLRAYKLSKRYDSDISALACGLWLRLDGDTVAEVRLAFGGMAATVRRAPRAEAALRGRRFDEPAVRAAMTALARDYRPLTDLRASDSYRTKAAANLLWRLWLQERSADPLPDDQTSVWSVA